MTEAEEKRAKKIKRGEQLEVMIQTEGWKEVLYPWMTGRIESLRDQLEDREGPEADKTRGSIKTYKAILKHIDGLIKIKEMAMKAEEGEEEKA